MWLPCDTRVSFQHPLVITVWYSWLPPSPIRDYRVILVSPPTPTRDYRVILVTPSNTHSWLPCDTRVSSNTHSWLPCDTRDSLQHPLVSIVWYSCLHHRPTRDYHVILVSPSNTHSWLPCDTRADASLFKLESYKIISKGNFFCAPGPGGLLIYLNSIYHYKKYIDWHNIIYMGRTIN